MKFCLNACGDVCLSNALTIEAKHLFTTKMHVELKTPQICIQSKYIPERNKY